MITYIYECSNCNYSFEIMQSIKDNPLVLCDGCNQTTLVRLPGVGTVMVKNSKEISQDKKEQYKERVKNMKKLGSEPSEIPWWRSNKDGKIRKDIMKNPTKYIQTGET